MEKLLLRPTEAADVLGIGRSRAYELVASGEMPSVRIGRSIRVPIDALQLWVKNLQTEMETEGDDKARG